MLFDVFIFCVSDGVRTVSEGSGQEPAAKRVGLEGERPPTACIYSRFTLPPVADGTHRSPREVQVPAPPLEGAMIKLPVLAFDSV